MRRQRGAVAVSGGKTWVVWDRQNVCFPVVDQNAALTRLDFVVKPGDCPWIAGQRPLIRVAHVQRVPALTDDDVISHLTSDAVARLQQQIDRVKRTWAMESR